MLLKIWQHLEVRERILEPDSNEREQFSKIAQIENDQFKRKLIESIGLCHYRLANYEDALAQFQIVESLLKKHEHSHFKRLNMLFIHCFVGSQLIDQALGRYDHLLEYIRKHSEAEWEYACRAGTRTAYSWGNDINSSNANYSPTGIEETTEVGSYPPNPWGFYDMHGNVSELVMDLYGGAYLPDPVTDPLGISGSWRVMRGGSWNLPGSNIRSSIRSSTQANLYYYTMGFRICLKETP